MLTHNTTLFLLKRLIIKNSIVDEGQKYKEALSDVKEFLFFNFFIDQ